jgi:hypothetical protein|tara:strand:- start:14121 stop:15020 length:900 start_codon:yes stop_codon:yes gene_type:complete
MSKRNRDITYKRGFLVKPYSFKDGNVLFTDGTNNDLVVDQKTCECYGFTYNQSTGTCSAFVSTPKLQNSFTALDNKTIGAENRIDSANMNTQIIGNQNIMKGNTNMLMVGSEHEAESFFKNGSVLGGSRALINREAEVVLGGGIKKQQLVDGETTFTVNSRRQTSFIELSGVTIDNTATNLTIQGDGSSFINVQNNSIIGYDIYITRLELGGTSGTAGNYSYRNIRGAVKINQTGVMSFIVGFSRNIAKVGVNGTTIMADSTTGGIASISVNVQDRNNVHNLWSAAVTLHETVSETDIV